MREEERAQEKRAGDFSNLAMDCSRPSTYCDSLHPECEGIQSNRFDQQNDKVNTLRRETNWGIIKKCEGCVYNRREGTK